MSTEQHVARQEGDPSFGKPTNAWAEELSALGVQRFCEHAVDESIRFLAAALRLEETAERWNDWATAQLARGAATESEYGFRRALEIDPRNSQAAANLGTLLAGRERHLEAIHYLEIALPDIADDQRVLLNRVLDHCRGRASDSEATEPAPSGRERT